MVGRSLSEDERSAELLAVVRGLQAFFSSHGREAVFPDLSDKLVYGDYNVAGARGHQLLETVTAEINACSHIKSGAWPFKKPESVRRNYVGKIGANVGREDEAVFEAYALEQTRPEAASGSAPLTQRPAEEAANMAVDASPAPLGERRATAHNAGASAARAEAGCTSAGCEEEAAAAEADEARSGETAMGYLGEYNAAGEFEGRGVMRYANGDVYEGEYKAGEKEGRGVFRRADGRVYEGEYKAGKKEGRGVFRNANGDVYEGEWKAGEKEGRGVYRFADGDVYDGEWKAGEKEGRGVERYADGTVDSCLYKPGTWSREGVGWAAFSRRRFYQEGVRWEADGRRAARLHDEEEEEISLEEARQTAERLGLPIPSPLPSAA